VRIDIVTAFPHLVESPLQESILRRAQKKGIVDIRVHDLREYALDKQHQVDDYPYGGGPGMVLKPEPFFRCVDHIRYSSTVRQQRIILMSPQGKVFNQQMANELAQWEHLIFLCGRYKGVDERVVEALVTDEISIGDYVLSGGELPALVVIDAVVRLVPGVLGDLDSAATDSFQKNLLDAPYYTRPEEYRGLRVPDVLLSGHHQKIAEWREKQSLERTRKKRPDLLSSERRES